MSTPDYFAAAIKVAGELEGTCESLTFVLERLDMDGYDNNALFCSRLDDTVFCCTQCDWWFAVADTGKDVNGQWACIECSPEEDDED